MHSNRIGKGQTINAGEDIGIVSRRISIVSRRIGIVSQRIGIVSRRIGIVSQRIGIAGYYFLEFATN